MLVDRVHRLPRIWSNQELAKFAHLFTGEAVNVSAWNDTDKEGRTYREYFVNCSAYYKTNYRADHRGFQGEEGEIFLDLTAELPADLVGRFDVVFNHTTLEHIYDIRTAFRNLCRLSRDVVILVVPFMQQMHSSYGDYWRMSPAAVKRAFEDEGFSVGYLSFNTHPKTSVYVFAIATRQPERWRGKLPFDVSFVDPAARHTAEPYAGCHMIREPLFVIAARRLLGRINGLRAALRQRRPSGARR